MPYADATVQRNYQRRWIAERREAWIRKHGPCIDCGTWDDLQVDHVDASAKVSHRVWSWSITRREAELAKCVVRCHPCHVKKTVAAKETAWGTKNGWAILTEIDVREIRTSSLPRKVLAERYGVSPNTIKSARQRQSWKNIE
jgi:hypothetical protein